MACNDLPIISSTDGGTFRRLRVIEFKSRFCDNPKKENEFLIDPSLKNKMKGWRPYFMSILIHWYHMYQREMNETHRIVEPEEVLVATNRYKNNNDKFNDFFEDCIQPADTIVSAKTIYNLFCSWWIKNNSHAKIPDLKEMIRAFQIKYGEDDYNKHRGFYVRVNLEEDGSLDTFSEEF
jgi:phage/plasmid-associated DNA primase